MKRIACALLILFMIPALAIAEDIDLSKFSFDELRSLRNKVTEEMMNRPETEVYALDAGLYIVGFDIPSGDYIMRCGVSKYGFATVQYDSNLNFYGTGVEFPCSVYENIYQTATESNIASLPISLHNGFFLEIDLGQVLFYAKTEKTGSETPR